MTRQRSLPLFLAAAIAAPVVTFTQPAATQDKYPSRLVELIVPFAAGGGTDILARLLTEGLTRRLGQTFVVINRPGANTNLGTGQVARAKPDGYTLLMTSFGLAANPSLYRNLGFDPAKDLVPVSLLANAPTILVVHPSFPANNLAEFTAHVKANPGKFNYASYGVGSSPHIGAELYKLLTGTDVVHVPFNGGGPAAAAVAGKQVEMLFPSAVPVQGLIRNGSLKPIAVASDKRTSLLPELPTFREGGLDYITGSWFGVLDAGEDAAGDRRSAACQHRRGAQGRQPARQDGRARRRRDRQFAGGVPCVPRGRDRAAVEGDQERKNSARLEQYQDVGVTP